MRVSSTSSAVTGRAVPGATRQVDPTTPWEKLTPSERAVVELVVQGLSNPEVAQQLRLSPHTVKHHLKSAVAKVGVNSRMRLANELGGRRG